MAIDRSQFHAEQLRSPLKLTSTRVWRAGYGGRELEKLLGKANPADSHYTEDWIMSTVQPRNLSKESSAGEGLSFLEGQDVTLRDILEVYPEEALGKKHYAQLGSNPGILPKIIDVAEREVIQVHPDKETAMRLFQSPFGKTECWHVLAVREDSDITPGIYLGFKEGITREYWKQLFETQDIPAMLDAMHFFPVQPGDTFLVESGVPHAVSADFMFFEMQEPTDFTVRMERLTSTGFELNDFMCHNGLGFDTMFDCFHFDGLPEEVALSQYKIPLKTLCKTEGCTLSEIVGYDATDCFKLYRYDVRSSCQLTSDNLYSALYIIGGKGTLVCGDREYPLAAGNQYYLSACCEDVTLLASGDDPLVVFRCYGPQLK